MKKLDLLQEALARKGTDVLDKGLPYVNVLRAFSSVLETCFGNELIPGYETHIAQFKEVYLSSGMTVTPKVFFLLISMSKYVLFKFRPT